MKVYWIFARGPTVQENVVKRLYRRVKEFAGDCFRVLPISAIIKMDQLNPFESSVNLKTSSLMVDRNMFVSFF